MWFLAVSIAAAGDGFEFVRATDGCGIWMRDRTESRPVAMRAECDWPEVNAGQLTDMMSRFERYPQFVFPIDVSEVRREEPGRLLIYQRQEMFGISDREVLLWMVSQPVANGAKFAWTTANEEPLELRSGAIRTPKNDGYWQVTALPDGGSHVVHEIAMDAGGTIPQWLLRMVRTRGFAKVMSDVRRAGATVSNAE